MHDPRNIAAVGWLRGNDKFDMNCQNAMYYLDTWKGLRFARKGHRYDHVYRNAQTVHPEDTPVLSAATTKMFYV